MQKTIVCAVAALFIFVIAPMTTAALAQNPIFSAEVSAADRREHVVRVNRFGRYRFEASGADGVTLQVADKLRGTFAETRTSGMMPTIAEMFLEAGNYKVITQGQENAGGNIKVSVQEYVVNNDAVEYLVVHRESATSLDAAGTAAWWIFVPCDTLVYIEAMGRHLGGLVVFRSGEDMLLAEASAATGGNTVFSNNIDPQRPLNGLRIAHRLQRGKHLVVAYGGGKNRYTVEDEKNALFIQWMIQPLNVSRQLNAKIRESGINRYSLSPSNQLWAIESDTMLTLEQINVTPSGSISRTSLSPLSRNGGDARYRAILQFSSERSNQRYLSIIGKTGTEFKLTPINSTKLTEAVVGNFSPQKDGNFRIRTMHTGFHEDNIGASGVLIDLRDTSIVTLQADTLSEASPTLRRRFNLLAVDGVTSFLFVERSGTYRFERDGTDFEYRIKRFYVTPPRNYNEPAWIRSASSNITLDSGLYVINAIPGGRGGFGRAGFTIMPIERYRGKGKTEQLEPAKPRTMVTLTNLELKGGNPYRFYLNSQAPEIASLVFESLPLEEDGGRTLYFIDNDAEREELTTEKLPVLELGKAQYAIYDKKALKMYRFEMKEEGIYKLETMGRLHTKITVRNRAGAIIATASGNGAGRNSVIAEYFLPGHYVLVAETQNESAGQMGVAINKGDLIFGGQLQNRADIRTSVGAFGAVIYNITVNDEGLYGINSYGQSGVMRVRLEDGDGWPVFEHGSTVPKEANLSRGSYRLFSLPLTYASERVTGITRLGDISTGGCVKQLSWNDNLRSGMCYNFISIEPPTDYEENDHNEENEYDYSGSRRQSDLPFTMSSASVRVRIDTADVYEIYSQGGTDVSARLFNNNMLVARNVSDERNWNFVISEQLDSGTYRLDMTPGVKRFPSTQVFMRRVEDTLMQNTVLTAGKPIERKIPLNGKQTVIPLEISSGDVLTLKAASGSRIAAVLESQSINHTIVFDQRQGREIRISIPVEREAKYILKIRSLDGWSSGDVDLAITSVESIPINFQKALTGVTGIVNGNRRFGNEAFFRIDDVSGGPGHYELVAAENGIAKVLWTSSAQQCFQKEEESLLATFGNRLWIKATFKSAGKYNFTLNPVRLIDARKYQQGDEDGVTRRKFETSDQYRWSRPARNQAASVSYPVTFRESIPVTVRGNQNKIFEIDTSVKDLGLLTFAMNIGQPVAGLSATNKTSDYTRNGIFVHGGQYINEKICVTAIIPGDTGRIVAWNALSSDISTDGINGILTMRNFATEDGADTLKTGRITWTSQTPAAKKYLLEHDRDRLITAKLSPRSGVLYISLNGKRDMYYGDDGGAIHTMELNGGSIFLFGGSNEDDVPANIELETFASKPSTPSIVNDTAAFAKYFSVDTRQAIRANNRNLDSARLFRSGSVRGIDHISRSGKMTQKIPNGATLDNGNGVLFVDFAAGRSVLKLCPATDDPLEITRCLWGERLPTSSDAPTVTEMSKLTMTVGINRYNINSYEPTHANITAPAPVAAITVTDGKPFGYEEFWNELSMDIPLPKGSHTIGLRPLADGSLAGVPLTIRFYPILTLTEDEPLVLYLPPGEKRMARFDLERRSRVGIGLQVTAETVDAVLLDSTGTRVNEGRQIFTDLDKGTYYVLLSTPKTYDGTDVKVFLFGQNVPPSDPPQELVKWLIGGGIGERPR